MGNPFASDQEEQVNEYAGLQDKTPQEIFSELVGEGKKYSTPEELAKAVVHANTHISTIERENKEMRLQVDKARTVDDIMKQLTQGKTEPTEHNGQPDPASASTGGDGQDLQELVKKMLSEQEAAKSAQSNRTEVINALRSKYADKAGEVWERAERELGVDLESIAAKSPAAAYKILGIGSGASSTSTASSLQSTYRQTHDHEQRPPEGSKRLLEHRLAKGEISRREFHSLRYEYSSNPEKYNA